MKTVYSDATKRMMKIALACTALTSLSSCVTSTYENYPNARGGVTEISQQSGVSAGQIIGAALGICDRVNDGKAIKRIGTYSGGSRRSSDNTAHVFSVSRI